MLYRALNPDIKVEPVKNDDKLSFKNRVKNLKVISFCKYVVIEYAKEHNLNPFKILSEMYEKGYIDADTGINHEKRNDFVREYSYLCEDNEAN